MPNPASVDAEAAAADEFLASLQEPPADPPAEPAEPAPPVVTPPAAPAPAAPVDVADLRRQLDVERHRNDSLQGRLDSQLRPANDKVRELTKELEELKKRLDSKEKGPAATRHLRPEELASVDQADVDRQARVARGVAEDTVETALEAERAQRELQEQRLRELEAAGAQRVYDAFWARVDTLSPGSREINESDPGWARFLEGTDAPSGLTFKEIGEAAIRAKDVRRVAQLVDEYRTAAGLGKPATPAAPVSPKVTTQVRPGASPARPAPAPAAGPKPIYKKSQINKFYTALARGAFAGQEARAKTIEAELESAVFEGRVVPG